MQETIRIFGSQLLEGSGGRIGIARRHRDHYARLAAGVDWVGPNQVTDLDRLADEHGQLRSALEFSAETPREALAGLRLAADLWLYWQARSQLSEGRRWLARLLESCVEPTATRAKGLAVAGYLAVAQGDPVAATPLLQEAHALAEGLREPHIAAFATQYLGLVEMFRGNFDGAEGLLRPLLPRAAGSARTGSRPSRWPTSVPPPSSVVISIARGRRSPRASLSTPVATRGHGHMHCGEWAWCTGGQGRLLKPNSCRQRH